MGTKKGAREDALETREGRARRYWRGVRTTSLIHCRVFSSTGPATLFSRAKRSALIFWNTILPSPANTAAATMGNSTDFEFSAIQQS